MSDRLRDSLDPDLIGFDGQGNITLPQEAFETVHAAARRFLALTETGPDYEAAEKASFDALAPLEATEVAKALRDRPSAHIAMTRAAVDAALADYLTEEETE